MSYQEDDDDEEDLKSLSLDYLNLLINGQAFSDVTFKVDGHLVHAHRCVLAARSLYFRKFFSNSPTHAVVAVDSIGYEVFLSLLQFLYSGQVSLPLLKQDPHPNCRDHGCCHTHCSAAIDLALDILAAARSFDVDQLALLTQKQLATMVEKATPEDVMRVLLASCKEGMHHLLTTCSHLLAKSCLPPDILSKHLPMDIVAKIEELRRPFLHHPHSGVTASSVTINSKMRRMRRALDSSDVELVKMMAMGEGLDLDKTLALHYAVENCTRDVVKALLEIGAADVNRPAGPAGKTPLHLAAQMVCPEMVAVLLDHHADPNVRTVDGITPLNVLRTLTSEFLFKGAVPGLGHVEPNKLRLCLELVQSAALVMSREVHDDQVNTDVMRSDLDSSMVYLNLGMAKAVEDRSSHDGRPQRDGGIGVSTSMFTRDFS